MATVNSIAGPQRSNARGREPAMTTPPFDLAAFQQHIATTYGAKDTQRGTAGTFMYFMEEVGELAEALREPHKHDLKGEFADCLAWLVSLAHLAEVDLAAATEHTSSAINEPSASVDTPVTPCPMVQPMASMPPKPINTAPIICVIRSFLWANHSMRNVLLINDHNSEPSITPNTAITPNVSMVLSNALPT